MFTRFMIAVAALAFATPAMTMIPPAPVLTFTKTTIDASSPTIAAGYFNVTTTDDDAIIAVSSDCCAAVELHRNEMKNNVMSMRQIEKLPVKAGAKADDAAYQGVHIMLIDPVKPLKIGSTVKITFTFEKAAKQVVPFTVGRKSAGSTAHHH